MVTFPGVMAVSYTHLDVYKRQAQVGANASENALYAAFAPLDNPQIVAYCVIEHGSTGGNAGIAIRSVLDSYFASNG